MLNHGDQIRSPGGNFFYLIQGPICRLYDREELPWPSCSLAWKGKQPSWNRVGRRFVPDMGAMRFPSYAVIGNYRYTDNWSNVLTLYGNRLSKAEAKWWYSPRNQRNDYPEL